MEYILLFIAGLIIGIILTFIIQKIKKDEKKKEIEQLISNIKDSFGSLSLEALTKNSEEFLKCHINEKTDRTINNRVVHNISLDGALIDSHRTFELNETIAVRLQSLKKETDHLLNATVIRIFEEPNNPIFKVAIYFNDPRELELLNILGVN